MRKKIILKTAAFAAVLMILPTAGLANVAERTTITGIVRTGDFNAKSSEHLIGDFIDEIKQVAQTLTKSSQALETAWREFDACDATNSASIKDEAYQVECALATTAQGITIYQEQQKNFENLSDNLGHYRDKIKTAVSQTKENLSNEKRNLQDVQNKITRSEQQAEALIKKIASSDPDTNLSLQQSDVIAEVVDSLRYHNNLSGIYEQAIVGINNKLAALEQGEHVMARVQSSVNRLATNFDYRITEANEFTRLTRLYGLGRAQTLEAGKVVDVFNDIIPELEKMMTSAPAYAKAINQYSKNSDDNLIPSSAKPQTAGQALALLQGLLNRGGSHE